jgi:hypothetical protein
MHTCTMGARVQGVDDNSLRLRVGGGARVFWRAATRAAQAGLSNGRLGASNGETDVLEDVSGGGRRRG